MSGMETLASCVGVDGAARMRALAEGFGPYRTYVSAPQQDGIGRGLVRRHDALMNHVMSRAREGVNEDLQDLSARINLLRGTYAEGGRIFAPGCEVLLDHPGFRQAAHRLSGRAIVVPTMLYANILLPGQELPLHTDTPAFRGLDQTNAPEWLLVCMGHSGLFEDWRTPMIGAVSFFGGCEGGDLVCFPNGVDGPQVRTPAADDTAIVLDSEGVFHGVARVGGADHPAPPSEIGMEIQHVGGDGWVVRSRGKDVAEYRWGQFRFSVQWKAKCYRSEADRAGADGIAREAAEATMVEDLRRRGALGDALPNETELALRMIQTYVRFPAGALH